VATEQYIQELMDFVNRETAAQLEQQVANDMLSERAQVALGYAISNLTVRRSAKGRVIMTCPSNDSRFRPGDRLTFQTATAKAFNGILIDVKQGGRSCMFKPTVMANQPSTPGRGSPRKMLSVLITRWCARLRN